MWVSTSILVLQMTPEEVQAFDYSDHKEEDILMTLEDDLPEDDNRQMRFW